MGAVFSRLLTIAAVLGLAACAPATQPAPTPLPDTTASAISKDSYECRASAEAEAARRYPYNSNYGAWGGYGTGMSQTQDWVNRGTTRDAAFNDCMKGKGYTLQQIQSLPK